MSWGTYKCACGWFLSKVVARFNMDGIVAVEGTCKRHGRVPEATGDWWAEDFDNSEAE